MAHLDLVPRCEYAEEKRYILIKKKFKNAPNVAIFVAVIVKMQASSSTIVPSKISPRKYACTWQFHLEGMTAVRLYLRNCCLAQYTGPANKQNSLLLQDGSKSAHCNARLLYGEWDILYADG
jgi:hypothetical protein